MTKRLFILLYTAFAVLSIQSQEKISAYSRMIMDLHNKSSIENAQSRRFLNNITVLRTEEKTTNVETLIELNENTLLSPETLEKLGMKVINSIGNIYIINMPIENISRAAELEEIKSISISQKIRPLNDKARSATSVDEAHIGTELSQSFTGKDVVVGIVDLGMDYNHINFKDENGESRVKIAGIYDTRKKATLIYHTPEEIATLTTDYTGDSHGTHVAGIATGSYKTNNFYGMAPESDIVLYGLGTDLSNTNILNGIKTVFDYAKSVNKPAVVNMSLGTNIGSHDGSDSFNKALDELIKEGNILLVASGNEGSENLYLNKIFTSSSTSTPQLNTIINASGTSHECIIDTWSNKSEPIGIQFFIYNKMTRSEVVSSSVFYPSTGFYKEFSWKSSELSRYFNGTIAAFGQRSSSNNRYEMYSYIVGNTTSSNYYIGIKLYGKQNTEVYNWVSGATFDNLNNLSYSKGSPDGSYNDLGCSKESITVGAYCSKTTYTTINGNSYYYSGAALGDIAYFSSYGTDFNGRNHPEITAPGFTLVSSVNNYDYSTVTTNRNYLVNIVSPENDTRKYHWSNMSGTSMATPVATGTVALWLQANPRLTSEEIKSIMQATADNDVFTQSGNPIKWGAGKLNAQAGLIKILQSSAITDITMPDEIIMLSPNPSDGNLSMYIPQKETEIRMNVYNINGSLVYNETLSCNDGIINAQLRDKLSAGIYIVTLQGIKSYYTTRIIIK